MSCGYLNILLLVGSLDPDSLHTVLKISVSSVDLEIIPPHFTFHFFAGGS